MAQRTGHNKILGLAIGEKSLVVAEAARAGGAAGRVTQAATFVYPQGVSLDTPDNLGKALAEFLKSRSFSARHAVVGVPARWVLSKPKEVPPAEPDVVAEALRLQVEGEFSQELENLVFDYAGAISPTEPSNVLLVAIQGKYLDQIKSMLSAAKLSLSAVTPVGCVLGAVAAAGKSKSAFVVSVGPGGIELAAQEGTSPRALRHLGATGTSAGVLAGELRRAAFAAGPIGASLGVHGGGNGKPVNGTHGANGTNGNGHYGPALIVWDEQTLNDPSRQALADAVGARLEAGNLELLGVPSGMTAGSRETGGPSVAGAAALAVAALADEPLPADFVHSRLAAPKTSGISRQTLLIAVGGFLAFVLLLLGYLDLQSRQSEVSGLQSQIDAMKPQVKTANENIKRIGAAEKWAQNQPRFLNCLFGLTQAIPEDGKTYITNITLKENMKGVLNGRTSGSEQDVYKIVDRMLKTKLFANVKAPQTSKHEGARGAPTEIAFTIEFTAVSQ